MRVIQVLPELNLGGVEKGTIELAKYLALKGHYPCVISNGGKMERELQELGIKHYKLALHKKSPLSLLLIPRLIAIFEKEQVDIVHARSRVPAILSYFAFCFYMKKQNITRFLNFVPSFITTAHGYYRKHIFSRIMARGKFVISPSKIIAKHMIEDFGVPLERVRIIPRGISLKEYKFILPSRKDWKHPLIAIIARITPNKGHPEFIKAFRDLLKVKPFAKALIIGSPSRGKEDYLGELQLLIKRYGLENMVEFLGARYDIPVLLERINILVQPSRIPEAFGRVIIEAQAAGVITIATALGGYREIIENEKTGFLVPPRDERKLSSILQRIVKNPRVCDSLALAARAKVESLYNLDKINEKVVETYRDAGKKLTILILKLGALGDVILAIPSIRAIRKRFPHARICLLTADKVAEVFKNCPYIDKLLIYHSTLFKYRGLLRSIKTVKKLAPEISVDLQNNKLTRIIAYLGGVYHRYGFLNGKFSFLLNKGKKLPRPPLLPVDQQLVLLSQLGIRNIDKGLELWPEEKDIKQAEKFLETQWLSKKQILVGINIGSSSRWSSKRWPWRKIVEFIDELGPYNIRCILTGDSTDKYNGIRITKLCKNKPINAVAKTDIPLLIALIKNCQLYLTSDSAPLHIAAAVGTPVVALFGPTEPRRHLPPGEEVYFIWKKLNCSPCYSSICNKRKNCMEAITIAEVKEKVLGILKKRIESFNIK